MYGIIDGQQRIKTLLSFIKNQYSRNNFFNITQYPFANQSSNQGLSELVAQQDKLLAKILSGVSDVNIPFDKLCQLLINLGFDERIRGSHHIFTREDVEEILNIQPKKGKVKVYQVKQVREVILKYQLGEGE